MIKNSIVTTCYMWIVCICVKIQWALVTKLWGFIRNIKKIDYSPYACSEFIYASVYICICKFCGVVQFFCFILQQNFIKIKIWLENKLKFKHTHTHSNLWSVESVWERVCVHNWVVSNPNIIIFLTNNNIQSTSILIDQSHSYRQ